MGKWFYINVKNLKSTIFVLLKHSILRIIIPTKTISMCAGRVHNRFRDSAHIENKPKLSYSNN